MLKTITKFVLKRRRSVPETPPQGVVEIDRTDPPSAFEVSPQHAKRQLAEPPAPAVWGKVKWYNPLKRYGFVELSDGSGDAFIHATALAGIGVRALRPGDRLEMRVAPGQRTPQVTQVISVDSSAAAPPRPSRTRVRSSSDREPLQASVQETGTVKWYNSARGFGFIVLDDGGRDVFVHASALQRAGIAGLSEGQRVFVGIVEGRKGPEAASIQVA